MNHATNAGKALADAYAAKLIEIHVAAQKFGMSDMTFLRFRRRHGVPRLPGKRVHVDDVINGLERGRGVSR